MFDAGSCRLSRRTTELCLSTTDLVNGRGNRG